MDKSTCGYWIKWTPHHRRNVRGQNIHGHNNNASKRIFPIVSHTTKESSSLYPTSQKNLSSCTPHRKRIFHIVCISHNMESWNKGGISYFKIFVRCGLQRKIIFRALSHICKLNCLKKQFNPFNLILAFFHIVIGVLKRLPSVLSTRELTLNSWAKKILFMFEKFS